MTPLNVHAPHPLSKLWLRLRARNPYGSNFYEGYYKGFLMGY